MLKRQTQKRQIRQMSEWFDVRRGGGSNEEKSCEKVGRPEGDELTPFFHFPFFVFTFFGEILQEILQESRPEGDKLTTPHILFSLSLFHFLFEMKRNLTRKSADQNETSSLHLTCRLQTELPKKLQSWNDQIGAKCQFSTERAKLQKKGDKVEPYFEREYYTHYNNIRIMQKEWFYQETFDSITRWVGAEVDPSFLI